MTNPYFNHDANRVSQGTRALDTQINNIADEIALGFDRLPTEAELKENRVGFAVSTGTANILLVTLPYTPTLGDGFNFFVGFNATSTGSATIDVNSTGVKTIVNSDGSTLTAGAMASGTIGQLAYDLTRDRYILISNNSAWGKPTAGEAAQDPSEYCPGYTFVFVSTTVWRIAGFDVTNLFSVGRRLKFVDGANEYFGTITNSVYGTNTDMTMSMENDDVLTNTITEVCLTAGTAGWSPIATDPFDGHSINDICVGDIGATTWLFAVGGSGKCGVSSDGGINWTMLATGTTKNLNACVYDSNNETFWGGGDVGVLVSTANATSITLDDTSIDGLAGGVGTYNISGFAHNSGEDGLLILSDVTLIHTWSIWSLDQGATWNIGGSLNSFSPAGMIAVKSHVNAGGSTGLTLRVATINSTIFRDALGVEDTTWSSGSNTLHPISAIGHFEESAAFAIVSGSFDGHITGTSNWTGDDTATFSERIRAFAFSDLYDRLICVGDNNQLGYLDETDKTVNNAWTQVSNGFNPLASILSVVWDYTQGVFIAVADNGQICRSTNGIN